MPSTRFLALLVVALFWAASAAAGNNDPAPGVRPAIGGGHFADGHGTSAPHPGWGAGGVDGMRHFNWAYWRGGHWWQGPYRGRVGWWWIVGPDWYWYPAALYPYPDPFIPAEMAGGFCIGATPISNTILTSAPALRVGEPCRRSTPNAAARPGAAEMPDDSLLLEHVRDVLRADLRIGFDEQAIFLTLADGDLVIEGEVADVSTKRRALRKAAAAIEGRSIVDRLHVRPATPMADSEIRDLVRDALLEEAALSQCRLREFVKGAPEPARDPADATGTIDIRVDDGVVTLDGDVTGLAQKRMAGALAWWEPGRDQRARRHPARD
jgi:osmotically-inducible protein OsmY